MTTEEKMDELADAYNELCLNYERDRKRLQKEETETNKRAIQFCKNMQEVEAKAECMRIVEIRRTIKTLSENLNDAKRMRDQVRQHTLDNESTKLYLDASKLLVEGARTTKLADVEKATEALKTANEKYEKTRAQQSGTTSEETEIAEVFASVKLAAEASMGNDNVVRLAHMPEFLQQDKEVDALHKRLEALQR